MNNKKAINRQKQTNKYTEKNKRKRRGMLEKHSDGFPISSLMYMALMMS